MARPGRRAAPVPDPGSPLGRFAQGLRDLRDQAGDPGYEALARESRRLGLPYSATSLRTAASGRSLPSWNVTEAFIRACVEFARRDPRRAHPSALRWNTEDLLALWTVRWREISFPDGSDPPVPALRPPERKIGLPPEPPRDPEGAPGRDARGGLPTAVSRLVGREAELAEGERLLEGSRLVTVTGIGGVGKTRLVLELAERVAGRFSDGVLLVELAELDPSMSVRQAVAAALGVRVEAGRGPLEAVAAALAEFRTLLVLDNCEHLLDASAELARALLRAVPGLRVLASSRQALNLAGERVLALGPLPLPEEGGESSAMELFLERASEVVPEFRPDAAAREAVRQVCRRLDGLPLALELAARRLRLLSPQELLERLDLELLGGAGAERTAPARHRALRAVLDGSHGLCTPEERLLWERLSVCAGTVALADAEALGVAGGLSPDACFEALAGLVDKSLLTRVESGGRTRLHLLETVRTYGRERLAASGGQDEARRRHREHYLGLVVRAEREYASPRQREWLLRLRAEHADLRQALTSLPSRPEAVREPHARLVMEAVRGLWMYWPLSPNMGECALWMRGLTTLWPLPPSPALAGAWCGMAWSAAMVLLLHGDRKGSALLLDQVQEHLPGTADPERTELAAAVVQLRGLAALFAGDLAEAQALSLEAARTPGRLPGLLTAQQALTQVGLCHSVRGELEEATAFFARALELSESCGEIWHRSYLLWTLGITQIEDGRDDLAARTLRRALELKGALDDRLGEATVSVTLARLLVRRGDTGTAALLLGAVQSSWRLSGTVHLWGFELLTRSWEQDAAELRRVLGDDRLDEEFRRGERLGPRRVLELLEHTG
ncbi:AAA family ATPase [Actinocorallia sp. B10E7]|uniref:ATP-binding protein n=1 Tax=Actinocorallia sp. B10E7 TaxID=3153558 RepID=UPI00325C4C0C